MKVRDIVRDEQPNMYKKLNNFRNKEKLTEREIKNLMSNSRYKRGPGGAIRQVGFGGK